MRHQFRGILRRVRANNGIVEVFLVSEPAMGDPKVQEQSALLNLQLPERVFRKDRPYRITIESLFPWDPTEPESER